MTDPFAGPEPPPDPHPMPAPLQAHITDVLNKIQTGQRGHLDFGASTSGVQVGIAQRLGANGTIGFWAGRERTSAGWGGLSAGVSASVGW